MYLSSIFNISFLCTFYLKTEIRIQIVFQIIVSGP